MGMISNKRLGTEFEQEVCDILARSGYWVHFITPDARGAQPFDIIAVKDGIALAIECKTLDESKRYFPLSRLEENQLFAFDRWMKCGNAEPTILVKHGERYVTIPYSKLRSEGRVDMKAHNTEEMQWYIFTFGSGQKYAGHYVKFFGTYNTAREQMVMQYGDKWAFQYSQREWNRLVKRYGASNMETELRHES